jgi:hypothetical protein
MRTKTVLMTALLGALSGVSVMAQTNVYSQNAVGYINVTCPPGFSIISCPLQTADPSNTIATLLPNGANQIKTAEAFQFNPSTGGYNIDEASTKLATENGYTNGWEFGGTFSMEPGQALFFETPFSSNLVFTFVGTVPTGSLTNTINTGFNLISSILPASGDLVTNPLTAFSVPDAQDEIFVYNNAIANYNIYEYTKKNGWTSNSIPSDPIIPSVGEGFFYETASTSPILWIENYSVSQ